MTTAAGAGWRLREAQPGDEARIQHVVASVLAEFGWEQDAGGLDADLTDVQRSYASRGGQFLVLVDASGIIVGCGGLYPLDNETAELRKMYFEPHARGLGWGRRLLISLLAHGRAHGFRRIVLESNSRLRAAAVLYRSVGFIEVERHQLHSRCDVAMELWLGERMRAPTEQ